MNGRCIEVWQSDEDGWVYTCDLEHDHTGAHEACDYDLKKDCFREARWPMEPPTPLVRFVPRTEAQKALEPIPRPEEEHNTMVFGRSLLALPEPAFNEEAINSRIVQLEGAIDRVAEFGDSGIDYEAWELLQDLRTKYWEVRSRRNQLDDAKQAQYDTD